DKTGTLTSNEMELEAVVDEHGDDARAETLRDLRRLFASQSDLNNTAEAIVQGLNELAEHPAEGDGPGAAAFSQPPPSEPPASAWRMARPSCWERPTSSWTRAPRPPTSRRRRRPMGAASWPSAARWTRSRTRTNTARTSSSPSSVTRC